MRMTNSHDGGNYLKAVEYIATLRKGSILVQVYLLLPLFVSMHHLKINFHYFVAFIKVLYVFFAWWYENLAFSFIANCFQFTSRRGYMISILVLNSFLKLFPLQKPTPYNNLMRYLYAYFRNKGISNFPQLLAFRELTLISKSEAADRSHVLLNFFECSAYCSRHFLQVYLILCLYICFSQQWLYRWSGQKLSR